MQNSNIYKILDILRENTRPENYIYDFIIYYYLGRQLQKYSIKQIKERFQDENIQDRIQENYEKNTEYIREFQGLDEFDSNEILSIVSWLSEQGKKSGWAENITVQSIINLSLELLELEKEDNLLDVGSGIGATLLNAFQKTNIFGIEINPDSYFLSSLLFDLFDLPTNSLVHSDVLTYDLAKFDANKVFMNMPIAMKVSKNKLEEILSLKFSDSVYKNHIRSIDASWIFALDILENTEYDKFVMLVNGNPLYSDIHKDIRKLLVSQGKVESVIALPSNLLAYTVVPLYLIVFSHDNKGIQFVDANNLYSSVKYRNIMESIHIRKILQALEKNSNISKFISNDKIDKEDWTFDPLRYTMPDFPFEESVRLKDVVKVIHRGQNISRKDLENLTTTYPTDYQYLMLQNFQDGIVDESLPYLKQLDSSYDKFLLKDHSIIISRTAPFKIGTVDELKTNVLVNGNLFFLEIDEKMINKNFLAAYLQSKVGLKEIEKYVKGSAVKTISIRDLERIKIPKISTEQQIEIGNEFVMLNTEFKAIKRRRKEIEKERLNLIEGGLKNDLR